MLNIKNRISGHIISFIIVSALFMSAAMAKTVLILGDSLSAGYQLPVKESWVFNLAEQWQARTPPITVINASISGDTAAQGLARLPEQLKRYQPDWVLIELGANDGLRGLSTVSLTQDLAQIIDVIKQARSKPILMQVRMPSNYGKNYTSAFAAVYPELAAKFDIPLIPFYLEEVIINPELMLPDGAHPNADAQPVIMDWMNIHLLPLLQ